jgi:alkanesulfonate monooxygenase SsuD/methylene tetrahydromethanopterin reductase-like flavin-dependent oxidoreductase (luciferase family)
MKFHSFHLMPYPDLPADLSERHRSVWVDLPAAQVYDPVRGHVVYHDYLDQLEHAERAGFDGICVNEHHQTGYGLMPSPNLMAAALCRRTSRAKLVVMANSVALYNPPLRVAEELAMLDVMSGGRLVAGFSVGTPFDTAYSYGQNPVTLRERYREGVDLILRAWEADEPFPFNGKYTQLRYVNPWPRPIQSPRPPVWIPGSRSVETWEWCVEHDFLYANLSYRGWRPAREMMDGYWETVERLGADPNPYRAGFLVFVGVADSDAEAERLYAEHARYFFNRCFYIYPGFMNPPGHTSPESMRKTLEREMTTATYRDVADLDWPEIVDRGYVIAGSPDSVVQQLDELIGELHVGHLMVLSHFGSMPRQVAMQNTTRFAEEVMPRLRGRFSDWEDRWWPTQTLETLAEPLALEGRTA